MNGGNISSRKRRTLLSALLSSVAAPALLTACGSSSDSEASTAGSENKSVRSLAANAKTATTLIQPISLVVSANPSGPVIGSSFSGLSYEKSVVSAVSWNTLTSPATSLFNANNTGLVNLFKRLGPSILRIGGNSVDKTFWNPSGAGLISGQVCPSDIDRLAGFLRATGWKIIYGINFVYNTPNGVAAEAAYAASSFGNLLIGFEIGNEPDLYANVNNGQLQQVTITMNGQAQTYQALGGITQSQYTYADFLAQWNLCAQALQSQVPSASIVGPASGVFPNKFDGGVTNYKSGTYTGQFAADAGKTISMVTQHYYLDSDLTNSSGAAIWSIPSADTQTQIASLILNPDPYLPIGLQEIAAATKNIPGGFRMAEANIFYEGGIQGMTYSLATGLWAIDFLFINAQNGSQGVNFHSGYSGGTISATTNPVPASETPLSDDYTYNEAGEALPPGFSPIIDDMTQKVVGIGPEYYGMYLFSMAAAGQLQNVALTNPAGLWVSAYAVAGSDGSQYVMILNKDQLTTAQVTLQLSANASQATATVLASSLTGTATPSLQRGDSLTLNGAAIGIDGSWNPGTAPVYTVTNGNMLSLSVGPASAVLLKAH